MAEQAQAAPNHLIDEEALPSGLPTSKPMRIGVFGLGYVGAVSAACFANDGHFVVGIDPQQTKVDLINSGQAPIIERDLPGLIARGVRDGHIRATASAREAVAETDLSLVCVGTPSQANGNLDTTALQVVCREIGEALRNKDEYHTVVIRSTMLPGTLQGLVRPTLEQASGKRAGVDFGLANNPEFLRESTAVYDYYNPPKTVIGSLDGRAADVVATLYDQLPAPLIRTSVEVAEMCKYADNAWHALKVAFANEMGNICQSLSIDSHELMAIFCQDDKLNLSPYYLKPGFAFGGSCLPKDVRAITYKARQLDVAVPVLDAILPSNRQQVERALAKVASFGKRRIGVLGFSFKAGTDDLRESPVVELIKRLIGEGYNLKLYDEKVSLARLLGANREFIMRTIPHVPELMVESIDAVLAESDIVIIGNNDPAFHQVGQRLHDGQILLDMVRLKTPETPAQYQGINW